MYLHFKKLIIHNFLSYGHSEIDLTDKDYCLVSGINKNPVDKALSNGSGKSSWSSAICWCLTGETVQGIKSGIKNINIDEKECYVTLYFDADKDSFEITRYAEPKSDLTIIVNGEDKSGKGIREGNAVLAQYLPDITSDLLGSVIILGQGLPHKFSSYTPSGRKECLEKMSKSDFMIQDVKTRLANIISQNNAELRHFEDILLEKNTKKSSLQEQYSSNSLTLDNLRKMPDFKVSISELENNIDELQKLIVKEETILNSYNKTLIEYGDKLNSILTESNTRIKTETDSFNEFKEQYLKKLNVLSTDYNAKVLELTNKNSSEKEALTSQYSTPTADLKIKIKTLEDTIARIKSIKEVCPTCGQKLIGVVKPTTVNEERDLALTKTKLAELISEYNDKSKTLTESYNLTKTSLTSTYESEKIELQKKYQANETIFKDAIKQIEESYNSELKEVRYNIAQTKEKIELYTKDKQLKQVKLLEAEKKLSATKVEAENYLNRISELESALLSIDNNIKKLEEEILYNCNKKDQVSERLAIDNKISKLISRDFRGFLLSNVISFIDKKAKEYSSFIFGSTDLDFKLDGNNIDITYLGKAFENLSGGEKQKVDLIIQFALRDMMSEYLQFSSNILVLDEIFDNLDSIGCNNLINLISSKLNDIESLFIISHHADELEIPYDCELVIEKDENGISRVI